MSYIGLMEKIYKIKFRDRFKYNFSADRLNPYLTSDWSRVTQIDLSENKIIYSNIVDVDSVKKELSTHQMLGFVRDRFFVCNTSDMGSTYSRELGGVGNMMYLFEDSSMFENRSLKDRLRKLKVRLYANKL